MKKSIVILFLILANLFWGPVIIYSESTFVTELSPYPTNICAISNRRFLIVSFSAMD